MNEQLFRNRPADGEATPSTARGTSSAQFLTFLSPPWRDAVERAAGAEELVQHATDDRTLLRDLRSKRWNAIIIDPTALSREAMEFVAIHAQVEGETLLLVAPSSPEAARRILLAASRAPTHVILAASESVADLLRWQLQSLGAPSARSLLLQRFAADMNAMPLGVSRELVSLFAVLPIPRTIDVVVKRADCSRRSFDRWMHRAGFLGGSRLLAAVRLAWAWELLRTPDSKARTSVALRCGYRSRRMLRVHASRLLDTDPDTLSRTPFDERLVGRLSRWARGQ